MVENLDDLLHNQHMVHVYQAIEFRQTKAIEESRQSITKVLRLFGESPVIKNFLVDDFFKRANETIERAASHK